MSGIFFPHTAWKAALTGLFSVLLVFGSCVSSFAVGDIYKYIDENGVIHFTNVPTDSSYQYSLFIKEMTQKPTLTLSRYSSNVFDEMITEASQKHGVSFPLLKAVIKVESDFNPRAVSRAGALGLMQIMPQNAKAFGMRDPFDPRENILTGTKYFRGLLERFNGKLHLALAAYNAGPTVVDRYNRVPPIKETEDYVERVMKYFQLFKNNY
ncbi:MAG: lytic transglycosylase domain-containing protein [Proteobacteria bacterium]|nr:lytic transglycosylase domain-containing protein [Pseudomonadota bacterium]